MKTRVAAAATLMGILLVTAPANALDCAWVASLTTEGIKGSFAVIYGEVIARHHETVTVRVVRSLKGPLSGDVRVLEDPGWRFEGEYPAEVGTDHVLYVDQGPDGALEVRGCGLSHAGPPSGIELGIFYTGPDASPEPVSGPAAPGPAMAPRRDAPGLSPQTAAALMAGAFATGLLLGAAFIRRRPRQTAHSSTQ